ncbi:MAG TPA: SEC-C metal-binding domain-containing protein [Candidatus Limnocylindria bacterium]|nr:SEC-C metal-binding domain-containing protein [Candidatus Limnocylindria bacterium]
MSEAVDPTNSPDEVQPAYQPPVSKLLTLGDPDDVSEEVYAELGIGPQHVPELLRMMTDTWLFRAREGTAEAAAPIHAWRAAVELDAMEIITPLIRWFDVHGKSEDDWFWEELAWTLLDHGEAAFPQISTYLQTEPLTRFGSAACIDSLLEIGHHYEELRPDCVKYLKSSLERFSQHPPTFNGFLINALIYFRALSVEPLIEQVMKANAADEAVCGDWESIQEGLHEEPDYDLMGDFDPDDLDDDDDEVEPPDSAPSFTLNPPAVTPPAPSIGRNDPCPCGSGKKYKKCCG